MKSRTKKLKSEDGNEEWLKDGADDLCHEEPEEEQ